MRTDSNWFPTYSGEKFYPSDPELSEINIEDIAHSLSNQCRFAGHTKEFYSVAQHCLLVSHHVPEDIALEGLLHDAAEAYCQDLIRPIKHMQEMYFYRIMDQRMERKIEEKFGARVFLSNPHIKHHDNRALMTERRDLFLDSKARHYDWKVKEEPYEDVIIPMAPKEAKVAFLARFFYLHDQRMPEVGR
jgi:hypothetical protein